MTRKTWKRDPKTGSYSCESYTVAHQFQFNLFGGGLQRSKKWEILKNGETKRQGYRTLADAQWTAEILLDLDARKVNT